MVMLPLAAVLVLAINVLAFAFSLVVPDWRGMGSGYELTLGKD